MSSLIAELEDAARIGADAGGVSRFAWTPELARANEWLLARLHALGLDAQVDAAFEAAADAVDPDKGT